jgi:hypothetical protein
MMNRRSFLVALALTLPLVSAEKCGKREDGHQPPDITNNDVPPAKDNPPEPDSRIRTVAITAWLEEEYGPYTVDLKARDTSTGDEASKVSEIVASGTWTYILAYPQGHPVQIDGVLHAARPGSQRGYLAMKDGPMNRKLTTLAGTDIAHVSLRTAR